MEAVWTRFFPLSVRLREVIEWGEIGEVVRVVADASAGAPEAERVFDPKHRMVNLDLAGGVLLDCEFPFYFAPPSPLPLYVHTNTASPCSGHLRLNMGLSDNVPHPPASSACRFPTLIHLRPHDPLPPDGRRRGRRHCARFP